MTRISTIHGIPPDEYAERGAMVQPSGYIPYLSLTQGEMELFLAMQRNKILAQWYGVDAPQYQQAVTMLQNALYQDIRNGVHFVGAIPDNLQNVARLINRAQRQNAPVSNTPFFRASKMAGIGASPIDFKARFEACMKHAENANSKAEADRRRRVCLTMARVEKILNDGIENSAHHMLYKSIPADFTIPSRVDTKRILHQTGVEGMAIVAKMSAHYMYQWVENGVIGKNASGGVGPYSSPVTSFALSPDADALVAKYEKNLPLNKKKGKIQGIHGFAAAVPIIVALVGAAASAAATILKALRSEEAYAMSEARGFGTTAWGGNPNDWILASGNQPVNSSNNTLFILGIGLAAILILSDDN